MKYNEMSFNSAVKGYKSLIKDAKGKNFFIVFDILNKDAFFSIAPLSMALHELGADVSCTGINKQSEGLDALKDVWKTFEDYEKGTKNENTKALIDFIDEADKKANGNFRKLFKNFIFWQGFEKRRIQAVTDLLCGGCWSHAFILDRLIEVAHPVKFGGGGQEFSRLRMLYVFQGHRCPYRRI